MEPLKKHVLIRLKEVNLKLKLSKCILYQTSAKFQGHIVSENGIQTGPYKISAIKNWGTQTKPREVKSLSLASYYRWFVQWFANITRPLHRICDKEAKFSWSIEEEEAFQTLKEAILAFPQANLPFILATDASCYAVRAVLSQKVNDREHVIAYISKALTKHELSYCVTRKELLAVVRGLKDFHSNLYG